MKPSGVCLGLRPWHFDGADDFMSLKWGHSLWEEDQPTTEWQAMWDAVTLSFEVGNTSTKLSPGSAPVRSRKSTHRSVSFDEVLQIRICHEDDPPFSAHGCQYALQPASNWDPHAQPTMKMESPFWVFQTTHDNLKRWCGKPWRLEIGSQPVMTRDDDVLREYLQPWGSTPQPPNLHPFHRQIPDRDQAPWIRDLWRTLILAGDIIDEDQTRELVLQTWYLDYGRLRRNERPRMIALYEDYWTWTFHLWQLWRDHLRGNEDIDYLLVAPDPPRSTLQRFHAHLILRQGAEHESAALLTATCQGIDFDAQAQFAAVVPLEVRWMDVVSFFEMQTNCQQRLCTIRIGHTPQDEDQPPLRVSDGTSILLTIWTPSRSSHAPEDDDHRILLYPPEHGPLPGQDPTIAGIVPPDNDPAWDDPFQEDFIEDDIDRLARDSALASGMDEDVTSLMSAPMYYQEPPDALTDQPDIARNVDSPDDIPQLPEHTSPEEDAITDDVAEVNPEPSSPHQNRYAAVVYTLQASPIRTRLAFGDRNRFYDQIARLLFVAPDRLIYLHSVPHPPEDLTVSYTTPMIAQLAGEQDDGAANRYLLVDVEFYARMPTLLPEVVRTAKLIPAQVTRSQLLQMLGVAAFCNRAVRLQSGCLMWLNHHIVNQQYDGPIFLSNGDYLRVALPPDQQLPDAFTTREAAEVCYHQNEMFASLGEAGRDMMAPLGNEIPLDIPIYYIMPSLYAESDEVSTLQQPLDISAPVLRDITNVGLVDPKNFLTQPGLIKTVEVSNSVGPSELCPGLPLETTRAADVRTHASHGTPPGTSRDIGSIVPLHPPFLVTWDMPLWAQQVQFQLQDFDRLRAEPEEEPYDLVAATWLLNHAAIRFNPNERHVRLSRDPARGVSPIMAVSSR